MVGITQNRSGINLAKGGKKTGKKRRRGGGSREGSYPIPRHCPVGTVGQETCISPGELWPPPAGTQDRARGCWQMPAHGCRSLRAKDIYHPMYSGSGGVRRGPQAGAGHTGVGVRWRGQGWQEQKGKGETKSNKKKECQEGGGELKGCHRLKTFTLMGCDRFNFQSTTIKVMDGRRSSHAWHTRALRGCRRVCLVAVIYEIVSAGAGHSSSAGGTEEGTRLMPGELGC